MSGIGLAVQASDLRRILTRADNLDLWHEADGSTREYDREYFGFSDYLRDVTALAADAAAAGLIELVVNGRIERPWKLTEAGERWLAEHAKENN